MAPLSLKVVQDDGAVTRTVKLESKTLARDALSTIKAKFLTPDDGKEYGLFLTSADDELSGVWLQGERTLDYYMLRDGDQLYYLCKKRNLRVRMLDGSVKTMQVDESKPVQELMLGICAKIGITNHDEYGLCHDEEMDEVKPAANVGTLTLKRVRDQKEKDAKLEQLSKKLKTDDNVQWLDQHKTLREMSVGMTETLLLKRRLFYSDRNVDARDPVQLNLLYVQARDAILNGNHPVTEDKAAEFAGIQCQIHYGDFQEDRHKTGLIENPREYLPEQYATSWGIEKKILKEYRKHSGVSPIDAKFLYTTTARDLPTYGVTFFLVKEQQKKKKKLIPRLLGINAESILRLDEVTKEILQVWPLTHVKSFQVGKTETFTLNFGDYSDKEYCVKTNDAVAIRDILQGYIDIIGKRLAGGHGSTRNDSQAIDEYMINVSRGNMVQHVSNNPTKLFEESFVGPTKIVSYEPGKSAAQGTQLVTVQQMMVTKLGSKEQFAVSGEVAIRNNMPLEFVRKLNRMNSNSVKIVTGLTDPDENSLTEAQKITDVMESDLPLIIAGIKEAADKQTDEDVKKKLLDELQELCDNMKKLSESMKGSNFNPENAQDAARKIADLSTQMYFTLDPGTRKRSEFCRRSRKSFIIDDKKDAVLRRASFIASAAGACSAVNNAHILLETEYQGSKLSAIDEEELEKAALDKMGKLTAAVALYLMAHADPQNIDYSAGITSMNTIKELVTELAADAQVLSSCKNAESKKELLDDMKRLLDATQYICSLNGSADHEKHQEAAKSYADVSNKLTFTLSRGSNDDRDNNIINLSKDVGDKTSLLLMKVNELTTLVPNDPAANDVDAAGVTCADAAADLLTCAMLTAPSIHEPHCQSALTAAGENLSSSAQKLLSACKPLVDDPSRHQHGEELKVYGMELAKALDRLKNAYGNIKKEHDYRDLPLQEQRLKFVTTLDKASKVLDAAEKELRKPPVTSRKGSSSANVEDIEKDLAQKMAHINSAVAALIAATSDPRNPDYATAELAVNTINDLMPGIIKDTKTVSASKDDKTRAAMLADLKELCEATRAICLSADSNATKELHNSASRFAKASNRLLYVFRPSASGSSRTGDKEGQILDTTNTACAKASEMLATHDKLARDAGVELPEESYLCDAVNVLHTTAQLTAPCIEEPRCQAMMKCSVQNLSSSAGLLASRWSLMLDPKFENMVKQLNLQNDQLQNDLSVLERVCQINEEPLENKVNKQLQFTRSLADARDTMSGIQKKLNEPMIGAPPKGEAAVMHQLQMCQHMGQLNAALATLAATAADSYNPNYKEADEAVRAINEIMPQVIKETKAMAAAQDDKTRAAMMADLNELCGALKDICGTVESNPEQFNNLAEKFSNASSKLIYTVNPRAKAGTNNQVIELAQLVHKNVKQLQKDSIKLADEIDPRISGLLQSGNMTAQAADALLAAAQLTSSSLNEPRCRTALSSSADKLAASAQQFSSHWRTLQDPIHKPHIAGLEKKYQQMKQDLDKLMGVCSHRKDNAGTNTANSEKSAEEEKRQLVNTATDAKMAIINALKELEKPLVGPPPKGEAAELQKHQLSERLAKLNAALAALAAATKDQKNPDHAAAEKAISDIKELMPNVIKNTNALTAGKDEKTRNAVLKQLQDLSNAVCGICENAERLDTAKLNQCVSQEAMGCLGKLYYALNPNKNKDLQKEVVDLCKSASCKASELMTDVYYIANAEGHGGPNLEAKIANLGAAAKVLLTTVQESGPYINEPERQSILISCADALSTSAKDLTKDLIPLLKDPKHGSKIRVAHQTLEKDLENLRQALQAYGVNEEPLEHKAVKKQQYTKCLADAQNTIKGIQRELNEPVVGAPPKGEAAVMHQLQICQHMGQLNAALATLAATAADSYNPNYKEANEAARVINEIMPQVVKETKAMAAAQDDKTRAAMMAHLNELCDALQKLCGTADNNPEQFNNLAAKFANASSKLVYTVNPRAKVGTNNQVIELAQSIHKNAKELQKDTRNLSNEVDPRIGGGLLQSGNMTAQAADALLAAAQLTSSNLNEPRCRTALSSSADKLAASAQQFSSHWRTLQDPIHEPYITGLEKKYQQLKQDLDKLTGICSYHGKDKVGTNYEDSQKNIEEQKCKLVNTAMDTKMAIINAVKELDKPVVGPPPKGEAAELQKHQLSQRLAKLNAALAALALATKDPKNPDHDAAEKALNDIKEVMPNVIKNTNALTANKDEETRSAILKPLQDLYKAVCDICEKAERLDPAKLNQCASQEAMGSLGKLYYVLNPDKNKDVQDEVEDLSKSASCKASELMTDVYYIANAEGHGGPILDAKIANLSAAAKVLQATVQETGPNIHEPEGQSKLISCADALSASAKDLTVDLIPLLRDPKHGPKIREAHKTLEMDLENLRRACRACEDESIVNKTAYNKNAPKKTDDTVRLQFVKSVEDGAKVIKAAEDDIKKICNSNTTAVPLDEERISTAKKNLEDSLARANAASASLLACNTYDSMDFAKGSKIADTLSALMPEIAKEAKLLSSSLSDKDRKAFLDDVLALFDATNKLCDAATKDRKKLNEISVDLGNKSAKILYAISEDADSGNEQKVIQRAREIGNYASHIAISSTNLVNNTDVEKATELGAAAGRCADAAGTLVYTAKLLAPSIHDKECQETLKASAKTLSTQLTAYSTIWKPLRSNPELTAHIQELSGESEKLQGLLENLRADLDSGKLVVKKEKLIIEDTPLRMLAIDIIGNTKRKAASTELRPEKRNDYLDYAKALEDAVKAMDLANAACKMAPYDLKKHQELEDAVQNLEVVALQMRPAMADKPQNNIVDLTDFVKDLSVDAEKLTKATKQCSVKDQGIEDHCSEITLNADRIMNPDYDRNSGCASAQDINEIDQFARDCLYHVDKIYKQLEGKPDTKDKTLLQNKTTSLEESCNMLRFATQSAMATSQSASLNETLNDLIDLDNNIDQMLAVGDKRGAITTEPFPWSVRSNLLSSVQNVTVASSRPLTASLAAYIDEHRSRTQLDDPNEKKQLRTHLKTLMHFLKVITVSSSRRVATWQEVNSPDVAIITEQILKEIDTACDKYQPKREKSVLEKIDLNKLLLANEDIKTVGDVLHTDKQLQQTATKLSSMTATIIASASKPDSLARSLHTTAVTASSLAAMARSLKSDDPIRNAKIEEATREMTAQTYNVLQASELVSQEPDNPVYRRRLLDACRMLNEALNKLSRTTSRGSKLQNECSELTRNMQMQQGLLQGTLQPTSSLPYSECVDALQSQQEVIQKLNNDEPMSREEFGRTLSYVTTAVGNSTEIATQCAYFLSLSERDPEVAKTGVVDVQRLRTVTEAVQITCYRIIRLEPDLAKSELPDLMKQVEYAQQAVTEAANKSQHLKEELLAAKVEVKGAAKELQSAVNVKNPERTNVTKATMKLLDAVKTVSVLTEHPSLVPKVYEVSTEAQIKRDDVLKNSRDLTSKTISLIREVKDSDDRDPMTWVMYNTGRKDLLKAFEALMNSVRDNGKRAGILELSQSELEESEAPKKSFVQTQVELANKWLKSPNSKPEIKSSGETAVHKVIEISEKMVNDMKGAEKEEMAHLIIESKQLLADCSKKYDAEKSKLLMERLKTLRKYIERGVVTMIVEDFIEGEEPLADLEILVDAEKDESKRKFLLEKKIAELLAKLGRVTKTARFVADTGSGGQAVSVELKKYSDQTELLAPMLVKAAQDRIRTPNDTAVIDNYKKLLAQYAESLSKVRDLCDQSVDPMEFVQTAGDTMQRMREESSNENDPHKCSYTSTAITKLANRVINVSMSSNNVKHDPELHKALTEAQKRITAAIPPPNARVSKIRDWRDTTAELLMTTGDVECALRGETIFNKQPESDQPIFAAAAGLHAAVRDWSARDNEIVAVAKRMAVLMAKLSDFMMSNKKRELIMTSKSIVTESHEVADLARKLAHECTDVRIKTNLLKTCERIPTISGQLKMLTTIKGSTLGNQGTKEDQEDINMLVDNARNLMLSIEEVVKVAAGASVKIMSQRGGPRVRWVRKTYYY